jgi:hypothetical protein
LHSTSTDAGISKILKPLSANADSSIRCNFEFDSNVTDVSDVQVEKQSLVNREIDDEIQALSDAARQNQLTEKVSITPSRTVILRENAVVIFAVPHCEAWFSLISRMRSCISRL